MHLPLLAALAVTAAAESTPSCARRGLFDLSNPGASLAMIQPPIQMDLLRCMGICRLYPGCGGFASSGRKLPTDWCFLFKAGVSFDSCLSAPTTVADDAIPVWFWEATCIHSHVGL